MSSIGRYTIAATNFTQENIAALANLTFDFSLVKVNAPPEYGPLGSSLSRKRRRNAEDQSMHTTAQQLGALFADDLPNIPHLTKAYGLRVSEIAENSRANPQATTSLGAFAEYAGADGTSIWAAATSRRGAMATHLLACLLSRVWSSAEATAIWSELVSTRQNILQDRICEDQFHFHTLTAARIEISRDKLAEWDASARAWRKTADSAMERQQTQLQLIIDNLQVELPVKLNVYDEVMNVWFKSMTLLENLISGVAQCDSSGEALLGLCTWHIYPDMCVIGRSHSKETSIISQHDHLIADGGLLTLGLQNEPLQSSAGITWSMPLAHLRFYGKAVKCHRTLNLNTSRKPFRRILHVAIGSLASQWSYKDARPETVAEFLVNLADACTVGSPEKQDRKHWLAVLATESKRYLDSPSTERSEFEHYFRLGRRRSRLLANESCHPRCCFGLNEPAFYLPYMQPDEQIRALRRFACLKLSETECHRAIIRLYRPDLQTFEFASIAPVSAQGVSEARRWILLPSIRKVDRRTPLQYELKGNIFNDEDVLNVVCEDTDTGNRWFHTGKDGLLHRSVDIIRQTREACSFLEYSNIFEDDGGQTFMWKDSPKVAMQVDELKTSFERNQHFQNSRDFSDVIAGWRMGLRPHAFGGFEYTCVFGQPDVSGIYIPCALDDRKPLLRKRTEGVPTDQINKQIAHHCFHPTWLRTFVDNMPSLLNKRYGDYFRSLDAIAAASRVYETLPNAEIELRLGSEMQAFGWAKALAQKQQSLTREIALSCVTSFETGGIDIDPRDFRSVIAVSSGNSIYATESMFRDPSHNFPYHQLRHVVGNVGKPGVALLLSSQQLEVPEIDEADEQFVNLKPFDGQYEDQFRSTSVHMWLTGYEQALQTHSHGARDREIMYLEVVTSAYEARKRIADIDFLKITNDVQLPVSPDQVLLRRPQLYFTPVECIHDEDTKLDPSFFGEITAIDNWFEVIDKPPNSAIIRATGNWLARLSLTAMCLHQQRDLVIFSGSQVCWACAKESLGIVDEDPDERILFLC